MNSKPSGELKKLRAENAQLKAELRNLKSQKVQKTVNHTQPKSKRSFKEFFRKIGVVIFISLAVALLTIGNLLFWFGNTIVKQDRFVAATSPIIKDPGVQTAAALYTTNSIFNNIDVQQNIQNVLPPKADFLAPQLANQLKSLTNSSLNKALANPKIQNKWNDTLAKQHERLINFASKYEGDGDISLNDVFNQLTASLSNTKLGFLAGKQLPSKIGDITIINATWLPAFHNLVVNIDTWRLLAIISMLVLLAVGLWLSKNRRTTLYTFAIASALLMVASLVSLGIVKNQIVNKVDPQYSQGVQNALGIFFHSFVIQTVTIILAALVIWFVAWVTGPSKNAAIAQRQVGLLFSGKLHEQIFAHENRFTMFIKNNKRVLEWGIVAALSLLMLLVRITPQSLFIYLLVMLLLVLTIETIGGHKEVKET